MASVNEIMQLCRLCLVKEEVNVPIFEEQGDLRQIFLKISACLPVKVSREDNLPKSICDGCSCKLEMFYQFWNTSTNSEKKLIKWLNQGGIDKPADKTSQHSMNIDPMILKQEVIEVADNQSSPDDLVPDDLNVSNDAQDYILQQQQLPYQNVEFQFQQDGFEETTTDEVATTVETEAPPTRKRRAAAMRALANMESEDEDDVDLIDTKIAKTEEQSDDSVGEDPEPTTFVGLPSATDNEQPGPSGVGKTPGDAPYQMYNVQPITINSTHMAPVVTGNRNIWLETQDLASSNTGVIVKEEWNNTDLEAFDPPPIKIEQISTTPNFHCPKCDKPYPTKDELQKHVVHMHTQKSMHPCKICGKLFKRPYQRKLHEEIHVVDKIKHGCDICNRSFRSKWYLARHKDLKHLSSFRYKCEICNQPFVHQSYVNTHVKKVHLGFVFTCSECGKRYKHATSFKDHQRTHLPGYIPTHFKCEICKAQYAYKSTYVKHMKGHNMEEGAKGYVCDTCGKRVASIQSFRQHLRLHTGEKPFKCYDCGKEFASKQYLIVHVPVHTKEKRFGCNLCRKRFSQRSTLTIHLRQHSGERPYVCSICKKSFISKTVLTAHMKVHQLCLKESESQCN